MSLNNTHKRRTHAFFASIKPNDSEDPNVIDPKLYTGEWKNGKLVRGRRIAQAGLIADDKFVRRSNMGILQDEIVFVDPYPQAYKARLANAYEFDSIIRTGIDTLTHYILGRDFTPKLRPVSRKEAKTDEEFSEILAPIITKDEQEELMDYINNVDHTTKLKQVLKPLLTQKYVYGRSAALIERAGTEVNTNAELAELGFTEDTPLHLKVLNSYYLGQNHYNIKTWEVEEIEYDSPNWIRDESKAEDEQPALPIEDLIYFTHADNAVIPNAWGYGMSALENILALSGANRRLNEKVLPELNTSAWAGSGIFKFQGMSSKQMANFVKSILPATWKATNQEVSFEPIKLEYNGDFLLNQRDSNVRHIATQLRIPSFLINFEDVTNRSIGDRVSNIWQQGDLEFARDELRDQLWEFWYRRLMELFFRDRGEEFLHLKAKIVIEFQSIDFSNFFEKAIAGANLVQNRIFTVDEVRELLSKGPYPEDQLQLQDNIERLALENPDMFMQGQQQQQGGPQVPGQPQAPAGGAGGVNTGNLKTKLKASDLLAREKRKAQQLSQ